MIIRFLNIKSWRIFIYLLFFICFISFATSYLFLVDNLYYQSLAKQLEVDRITKIIEFSRKWQWLIYIYIPFVVLIRVGFSTFCLYTGCYYAEIKIRFHKLFKISLLADFVFVFAGVTKLVILIFFKNVHTLDDLQFQPFSLLELFDRSSVEPCFIYPLSLIGLFELIYWVVLARLLAEVIEQPFEKSLKMVALSYGSGLVLWVLFGMFLTINLT